MITLTAFKSQANILKSYLNQNNASVTHSSCLHAVAKMYGFKDWNTASAYLKDQNNIDNTATGSCDELSNKLSAKVIEGALYQLIKLCGVNDIAKELTVFINTADYDNPNANPIAFKLESPSGLYQEATVSCGDFSSIKDKNEISFLSGHYLGLLIHDFIKNKDGNKQIVDIDKNNKTESRFSDSYNDQQNKLKAHLRGKKVKITFECRDPEKKPSLLKVKNILDSTPLMDDELFLKIDNLISHYYFLVDGFENEIRIYKHSHPEFPDDEPEWVATIEPVGQ